MNYKVLPPQTKEIRCDFHESCQYHQEALLETDKWMHTAIKYKHEAIEWKEKAQQYEKIIRLQSLLKEENSERTKLIRTFYRLLKLETLQLLLVTSIALFMIIWTFFQKIEINFIFLLVISVSLAFLLKYVQYYGD
jgi:hypothetical protein